jgi:seryl-tRNA synthetase
MLDVTLLRRDPEAMARALGRRGFVLDLERWQELELERKCLQVVVEQQRARRHQVAKAIGQAKAKGEDVASLLVEGEALAGQLRDMEAQLMMAQQACEVFLLLLPNLPHESVPDGLGESDNVVCRLWGEERIATWQSVSWTSRDHVALGMLHGGMDFESAARMAGARFVVLQGNLARLHRALGQFMLDMHTTLHGYQECHVPYLLHEQALYGTGQLPRFAEDLFAVSREKPRYLLPTGEVPLTNLVAEQILDPGQLPLRFAALTPCFRAEAGAAGRDTRGMIRQHQFDKVELVQVTTPELGLAALEELTGHAEAVLQALELPYRVMALCTGDLGFAAAKTYDLEVWLPGQGTFREISSCSWCEAFQARRLKARYRSPREGNTPVHTLNGSGVAVGRALVALLENHQQEDGSIVIPNALQPYMGGIQLLEPPGRR